MVALGEEEVSRHFPGLTYSYPMMGLSGLGAAAVGASRETDVGILWAAHAQAQGLIDLLSDEGAGTSGTLKSQLSSMGVAIDAMEAKSSSTADADWGNQRQALLIQLEALRVNASRALTDKRRWDQAIAASAGALVAILGVGVWAVFARKRKNR